MLFTPLCLSLYTLHFVYSTMFDDKDFTFCIQYYDVVVLYNVNCTCFVIYNTESTYLHAMLHDSVL